MKNNLVANIKKGVNTLFTGAPGVGKSAAIIAAVEKIRAQLSDKGVDLPFRHINASQTSVWQLTGLLKEAGDHAAHLPMEWAIPFTKTTGVVFVDEINSADEGLAAALLSWITEGVVGSIKTRKPIFIAAMNPPHLAAGGRPLAPALSSRFSHFEWEVDYRDWVNQFPSYWGAYPQPPLPFYTDAEWTATRGLVASFISTSPQWLVALPKRREELQGPWPNPRAWERASLALLGLLSETGGVSDVEEAFKGVSAAVGQAAGTEFTNFLAGLVYDPQEAMRDPSGYPLPDSPAGLVALATQVAGYIDARPEKERPALAGAAWVLAGRIREAAPDIGAFIAVRLYKAGCVDSAGLRAFADALKSMGVVKGGL